MRRLSPLITRTSTPTSPRSSTGRGASTRGCGSRPNGVRSTSSCSGPTSRSRRPAETAAGLRRVNDPIEGTKLPPVPLDKIEELIARDPLPLLGLERP